MNSLMCFCVGGIRNIHIYFGLVVIVSGNALNQHAPVIWICPLTTKLKHYHGNLILNPTSKNGLTAVLEVLTFHLRSVASSRLKQRIGAISKEELNSIIHCVNDILKY